MKRTLGLLALGVLIWLFPSIAKADAMVTVDGTSYDITLIAGTYNDNSATLDSNPWFGNEALADTFAQALGALDGTPQEGIFGPYFVYAADPPTPISSGVMTALYYPYLNAIYNVNGIDPNGEFYFATINTPEPGTLVMMFAGILALGLLAGMKRDRRKRLSAQA